MRPVQRRRTYHEEGLGLFYHAHALKRQCKDVSITVTRRVGFRQGLRKDRQCQGKVVLDSSLFWTSHSLFPERVLDAHFPGSHGGCDVVGIFDNV